MIIGVPKEIKVQEYRVGLVPAGVHALVSHGHTVLVQKGAGLGSGISDEEYITWGAQIVDTAEEVWKRAEMIIKVKEPIAKEYPLFQEGQVLYTYFHLAACAELAPPLIEKKIASVAYETIELDNGALPLLRPMSEVAGRMAIQVGACSLQKEHGGKGVLLPGVPGVQPGKVVILGGGTVGTNAAKVAVGMGADVTILDNNIDRLVYLDDIFGSSIKTQFSTVKSIEDAVLKADLVVGGVLVTGAKAPKLVSREQISRMAPGTVIVDVAVDQGGCIETCRATTHEEPTFTVDGVVHYCVANMPGAVARTSTFALTNATLGFGVKLANMGIEKALAELKPIARGINTYKGNVVYKAVAEALNYEHVPLSKLL